jgi:hypothetical protein
MKPSYIAVGVIGLALGGLWYAAGGTNPPAAQAGEPLSVVAPLTHDNLTVFLVRGPDTVDSSRVVTLQEALERKWAVVHETGSVNELVVENLSADRELFVQSGDIIKGGRQDRLIAADLLVPPAAGKVAVRVHCVEAGRWTGRANEATGHFAVSDSFAVGNDIKLANAARDQSEVWAKVKASQDKLSKNVGTAVNAAASPTSLQLALENPAVRAKADAYRSALAAAGEARGVVGAVFVVNGRVTGAEVYGSNGLFRKAWPKLLKAASEEALAEKADGRTPPPPTAHEVERFLATAGKEETGTASATHTVEVIPNEVITENFIGRSGATRSQLLRSGGGNQREAAVQASINDIERPLPRGGNAGVAFSAPGLPSLAVNPTNPAADSSILGNGGTANVILGPMTSYESVPASATPRSSPEQNERVRAALASLRTRGARANSGNSLSRAY